MTTKNQPIAIVGIHGRFPDAYDIKSFWENLLNHHDPFRHVPSDRWDWREYFGSPKEEGNKTRVNCAAFIPDVDKFDYRFFGIMPREAESMDPQQRLFLQTAFQALEDASIAPSQLAGSNTGVFVGVGNAEYHTMSVRGQSTIDLFKGTGLAVTAIANRVSFHLDIHGPSETIDTACSGSLVAIHRACQSIREKECSIALVGGVNLLIGPDLFVAFDKAGMLSPDSRSKTFDDRANGYARGEGVAALVLKPLEDAKTNGDYIYALIHGSAVNHGGRAHSFTAPNSPAQSRVIISAWENAQKDFNKASIIETHGTGTPLGDPIEINGIKLVSDHFKNDVSVNRSSTYLGALKSHVGHMEATAGIGGVIKTIMSLNYSKVPANQNFHKLNKHIDLNGTCFKVPMKTELLKNEKEKLGGISSFGFGGVNAHVVIGIEHCEEEPLSHNDEQYLILLSAKSKEALDSRISQLYKHLAPNDCDVEAIRRHIINIIKVVVGINEESVLNTTLQELLKTHYERYILKVNLVGKYKITLNEVDIQASTSIDMLAHRINYLIKRENSLSIDGNAIEVSCSYNRTTCDLVYLRQLSRTLLEGRDHYKYRFSCVVSDVDDLVETLRNTMRGHDNDVNAWRGISGKNVSDLSEIEQHSSLYELAKNWVCSTSKTVTWNAVYKDSPLPKLVPLPAYPFTRDHIWFKTSRKNKVIENDKDDEYENKIYLNQESIRNEEIAVVDSGNINKQVSIAKLEEGCLFSMIGLARLIAYVLNLCESGPIHLQEVIISSCHVDIRSKKYFHVEKIKSNHANVYCVNDGLQRREVVSKASVSLPYSYDADVFNPNNKPAINEVGNHVLDRKIKSVDFFVDGVVDSENEYSVKINNIKNLNNPQSLNVISLLISDFIDSLPKSDEMKLFVSRVEIITIHEVNISRSKSITFSKKYNSKRLDIHIRDDVGKIILELKGIKLNKMNPVFNDTDHSTNRMGVIK